MLPDKERRKELGELPEDLVNVKADQIDESGKVVGLDRCRDNVVDVEERKKPNADRRTQISQTLDEAYSAGTMERKRTEEREYD